MLDTTTKRRIDDCRDILVGKLPDPKSQIEQITIALIYKFMDDMDKEAIELGGKAKFFADYTIADPNDNKKEIIVPFEKYGWDKLFGPKVSAAEMLKLYSEAIEGMVKNPNIPELFANIFKNAYLPYRDPETLKMFLKTIGEFEYTHSEKLGDAFEYLLSVMGSQGDAGQFRTPRHLIDFLVAVVDPNKNDTILDPACGTAGFLISAFKYIKEQNDHKLTPDEQKKLIKNFVGYDISPDMVRLSLVNLYLHGFSDPHIFEYDSLSSEDRWNETFDVVLANPPFMSPKGGIRPHKKFTISSNRSEVLFVDYIAEHLNPKGRAGIIVPEGIIFQSGTAYKALRKMLVDKYLYAVVSLPAGVFNPYSGVKTSILLLDAHLAKKTQEILFVKIDNDGYGLGAQRNPVKGGQLDEAVATLKTFKENCLDGKPFENTSLAQAVSKTEIGKSGDYNLSGERYKVVKILSTHYESVKLGEVCELYGGGTPSKADNRFWNNGSIKWLSAKHIDNNGNIIGNELITEEAVKNSSTKIAPPNSLIFITRVSVGKYAYSKDYYAINQDLTVVIPKNNEKILSKFLYSIAPRIAALIDNQAVGIGVRGITRSQLSEIIIPLPPLSIQEEIVAEIESYQKIIDGAKMVVDNYKPRIDIDPSWEMVELGETAVLVGGGTPSKQIKEYWENGNIDWVSCSDFTNNSIYLSDSIRKITKEGLDNSSSNIVDEETLIMVTRVSLGKMAFTKKPTAINQDLTAIKFIDKNVDKFFVYYYLLSVSSKIEQDGNGITVKGVNRDYVRSLKIPKPSIKTQQQIVAQIEKEQALVNANKELIAIYEQKIKDRIAKVWGEKKKQ